MNGRAFLAALVALLFAAPLEARPRTAARAGGDGPIVVIAPFKGPGAPHIEKACTRALKPVALVLSPRRYAIVAKQLVARSLAPEDVAAVATELGAQWAVTGTIKPRGGKWTLSITLRDGKTGQARARLKYPLRGPRVPGSVLSTLEDELRSALDDAVNAPPPQPLAPAPTTVVTAPPKTVDAGSSAVPAAPPPPTPTPPPAAPTHRPKWARWFEIGVGPSLTGRHFAFSPSVAKFNSAVEGGIHVDATLYPLAFTWARAKGAFSGIGLTARVDKPFWPNSTTPAMPSSSFPTQELRVEGGLNWKITLYKAMPRPQLHLIATGGLHEFTYAKGPDGTNVVGVPNVRYTYASFGGGLTVHFADWSWIWFDFVYHLVMGAGEIETQPFYGLASHFGLRFQAGLDFLVWRGMRIGAMGFYERFGATYGFDPNRALIADTSTDEYYGAMLLLGYVF